MDLWVGCESRRWCPPFWGTKVAFVFGWVLLWLDIYLLDVSILQVEVGVLVIASEGVAIGDLPILIVCVFVEEARAQLPPWHEFRGVSRG